MSIYTGVYLSLNGTVPLNNSDILISEIGNSTDNILQCVTDRIPCRANPNAVGNWFFPGDGGEVPSLTGATTFGRSRGSDGTVNLHRVHNDVMMPTGQFCCVVLDATSTNVIVCANIGQKNSNIHVHRVVIIFKFHSLHCNL